MAQVGGRQVQIACFAVVLLVVTSLFTAPSAAEEIPDTPAEPIPPAGRPTAEPWEPDPVEVPEAETGDAPEPEPDTAGKVIHLTFDDGPWPGHTRRTLDLLDDHGAKATFFQVGEEAAERPELTRAVVARGHTVGNHSWSHRDLRRLSRRAVGRQLDRTSAVLARLTDRPITCMRPPYGAKNARVTSVIRSKKLAMKLWDIDPRDWKRPGAAAIATRVVSKARPGAVVLMHDGGGNRSQSVRALERILRSLAEKGFRFETLPGC